MSAKKGIKYEVRDFTRADCESWAESGEEAKYHWEKEKIYWDENKILTGQK